MDQIKITEHISKVASFYNEHPSSQYFHGLIIGDKGAGKTSLALTCPAPVYIFSFDPAGTSLAGIKEAKDKGLIIPDIRYEYDNPRTPTAYSLFESEFNALGSEGFFSAMGTVILDSTTTLADAAINQILRKEGRQLAPMNIKSDGKANGMQIQDWGTFKSVIIRWAHAFSMLPCHTLIFGHVDHVRDETTQSFVKRLMLPGSASEELPIYMPEFLVLKTRQTSKGIERFLLTQPLEGYKATTRIGGKGVFATEEPADIRALLKKAGLPYEDKPLLKTV